ncbi:TonB-dependent receptor [Brevundimonas vesicularis]|uniref:TonB-dependent receptor n=1 Tax=Brevundimonas vesicularis TaxID=41276 RepID=UPI0038D3C040
MAPSAVVLNTMQDQPPQQTATPPIEEDAYDLGEIVVSSSRPRGSALGDYEPELVLDGEQLLAYGASSIEELMTLLEPVTRSSRGGSPVFLVNGRRISGFREIRGIPPEAIERTEILPEETALAYGYSADQRVVNFVLKADFRSVTIQASARRPDQGGRTASDLESNVLRISGKQRWTLDLEYERDTPLFETERNIIRTTDGAPYDLTGNVTAPGGGEIDPALSALLGGVTSVASLNPGTSGSSLVDFSTGARTDDLTAYRSLMPKREQASISGSLVRDLNDTMSLTLSGELEDTSRFTYLGLPGVSLTLPAGAASPFGDDVLVHRYINAPDALSRRSDSLSGQLGFLVDGFLGDWRWTLNGDYERSETDTQTGRGLDASALQAAVTAGTLNPFGDLGQVSARPYDTARSVSSRSSLEGVINGTAWEAPAGRLTSTFKLGFDNRTQDSETLRSGVFTERSLSRDRFSGSGNFNLPIASRDREVLGFLGDLSANLNIGYEDLSDFGGLSAYSLGLNWGPWEPVNFTANWSDEQKAPSMGQLNDPTLSTPNVPVYDFRTGQSVNVTRIEGGNPGLSEETKRVLKLGVNLTPIEDRDLRLTANYTRTEIEGSIASFPTITPELEAALPERFTRDVDGTLLSIDARPLNFQKAEQQEIRWGLNFSTPFGEPSAATAPAPERAGRGPRPEGQEAPSGPRPNASGRPAGGPGGAAAGERPAGVVRMGPGGRGGRGGQMQPGQGRFNVSLYHTYRIQDEVTIREGLPVLDLLDGAATGSRGGQPRNEVQLQTGVFRNGFGGFMNANWKDSTRIAGGSSGDLNFSGITTVNLNLFADLSAQKDLVGRFPWLNGTRLSVGVENLFDTRLEVTDANGETPLSYQEDYLDPLGRVFRVSLRKILF